QAPRAACAAQVGESLNCPPSFDPASPPNVEDTLQSDDDAGSDQATDYGEADFNSSALTPPNPATQEEPHPLDFMLDAEMEALLAAGKFDEPPYTVPRRGTQESRPETSPIQPGVYSLANQALIDNAMTAANMAAALPLPGQPGGLSPSSDAAVLRNLANEALAGFTATLHASGAPFSSLTHSLLLSHTADSQGSAETTSSQGSTQAPPPHECTTCRKTFASKAQLNTHKSKEHSPPALVDVKVAGREHCMTIKRETRVVPGGATTAFWCPNCRSPFALPSNLRKHVAKCRPVDAIRGETSATSSQARGITVSFIRSVLNDSWPDKYVAPVTNLLTPWLQRTGFPKILQGQSLALNAGLVSLPSEQDAGLDGTLGPNGQKILQGARQAVIKALEVLNGFPVWYRQALNTADINLARKTRPMNVKAATEERYSTLFFQLVLYLVRLHNLVYGDEPDYQLAPPSSATTVPPPTAPDKDGLQASMNAMRNADKTLKSAICDIIANPENEQAYWRIGAFFLTSTISDEESNSLLLLFVASLAIKKPVNGAFSGARDFTPALSGLIFMLKLLWFPVTMTTIDRIIKERLWDPQAFEQMISEDHFRSVLFGTMHEQQLGAKSPWNCGLLVLMGIRTFGWSCARVESVLGRLRWDPNGQALWLDTHYITLPTIADFMKKTIADAELALHDLLRRSPIPYSTATFPIEHLTDEPSWDEPGAWFGIHPANAAFIDIEAYANSILHTFMTPVEPSKPADKSDANTPPPWTLDIAAIDDFLQQEHDLMRLLAVAIHITSGPPPRGRELAEASYKNGIGGRPRSILIGPQGEMWLDLSYSKTEWTLSRKDLNLRILQPQLGRIAGLALCTVHQLGDTLTLLRANSVETDPVRIQEIMLARVYVFTSAPPKHTARTSGPIDSNVISRDLGSRAVAAGFGFSPNLNQWRQMSDGFIHKKFRYGNLSIVYKEYMFNSADDPAEDPILSGYNPSPEQVDDFAWNASAAFEDRDSAGKGKARDYNGSSQDAYSAQSGRTLESSLLWYGRDAAHRPGMDDENIAKARLVSQGWQAFWGILTYPTTRRSPNTQPKAALPAPPAPSEATLTIPLGDSTKAPTGSDANDSYRAGFDKALAMLEPMMALMALDPAKQARIPPHIHTQPRAIQSRVPISVEDARKLIKVHQHKYQFNYAGMRSHSLADAVSLITTGAAVNFGLVARTGAGKSDTIRASTFNPIGSADLTVLVVPYHALVEDIKRWLNVDGIRNTTWTGSASMYLPRGHPAVLIVSLNKAVSNPFLKWVSEPVNRGRISRVIFDEAQVFIDERAFRQCIRKIPNLIDIIKDKRLVFLSATIPPKREADFNDMTLLPIAWKRELTHRDNLAYSVRRYADKQGLNDQLRALKGKMDANRKVHGGRMLVIAKTREQAKELAAELSCGYFYTEDCDEQPGVVGVNQTEQHLIDFTSGKTFIIVGTTALGVGVDISCIRLVVYVDSPYSMVSFAQCSGRAGRDGMRGDVMVFLKASLQYSGPASSSALPETDNEALRMMLSEEVCMRVPMGAWLDGRPSSCIELNAEPCSFCIYNLEHDMGPPSDSYDDDDDDDSSSSPSPGPSKRDDADRSRAPSPPSRPASPKEKPRTSTPTSQAPSAPTSVALVAPSSAYKRKGALVHGDTKKMRLQEPVSKRDPNPQNDRLNTSKVRATSRPQESWPLSDEESDELQAEQAHKQAPPASGKVMGKPASAPTPNAPASKRARVMNFPVLKSSAMMSPPTQPSAQGLADAQLLEEMEDRRKNAGASTSRNPKPEPTETFPFSRFQDGPVRVPDIRKDQADQLRHFETWKLALHCAVRALRNRCAVCKILRLPCDHPTDKCKAAGLSVSNHIEFRRRNRWGYGQACFYCTLPQDVCERRNEDKTCQFAEYKDALRAIMMFLTTNTDALYAATEIASYLNPSFDLAPPASALDMGAEWRSLEYHRGKPMYKAFQLVAALLFLFMERV
ncbi:hypothetical protein OC842_007280, partial [Tilletia horrida]